ncbi:MAG: hypothetical protein L0Y71_12820 [Gemmataceae bacterium]|nr:hypothetical protein [Gemmataceae bacterium]
MDEPNAAPPSSRQLLARFGGTALYLADGSQPWALPLDAMVVPTAPDGAFGRLGLAIRKADSGVISRFQSELKSRSPEGGVAVEPATPIAIDVKPSMTGFQPRTLIAATAWLPDRDRASIDGASRATRAIIDLSAERGLRRVGIPLMGTGQSVLAPPEVMRAILATLTAVLPKRGLAEVTVFASEDDAYQEALSLFSRIPQRFSNDAAAGEDLLDVSSEVQALTDILLLRSMRPPLAVGILGGWGSGKSFAMHLMRQHIQRIRSEAVAPAAAWGAADASPYVGHIYPIHFDAWTYAKSNLWASLMQTIFLELSRQVGLEQRIREHVARSGAQAPDLEGRLWLAMQDIHEADRATILQQQGLADLFNKLSAAGAATETSDSNTLWTAMATLKEKKQAILATKEKEKAALAAKVETQKAEITRQVDETIRAEAGQLAWQHLGRKIKDAVRELIVRLPGGQAALNDGGKVMELVDQAQKDSAALPMHTRDYVKLLKHNPVLAITGVAALLIPIVVGALFAWFQQPTAAVVAWVGSALGTAAAIAQMTQSWREKVKSVAQSLTNEVRKVEAVLDDTRKSRVEEILASAGGDAVRRLEQQHQEVASEIERLRQQIGVTADYVSLAELVSARVKKADYEGELGLMHRVQRDLLELTDALTLADGHPNLPQLKNHFPRGPARIVLFVDDLDRCPPDRVVEVLEATQLLVKTSLFVVVLALDARYVTRALEKVYKDILTRRGNPCGLDYIEKIIQLPYSVRPVDRAHLDRFLSAHMDVAASKQPRSEAAKEKQEDQGSKEDAASVAAATAKPITAEVVQFTTDELQWVTACCERVPLTPRAIKRVVNAFKLLKIVWHRPNRHQRPGPEVQQAFVALLCLSARHPHAMRFLFERVAEALDPGKDIALRSTMHGAASGLTGQCSASEHAGVERHLELIPQDARLTPGLRPTFELVRSLSFVAEIGYNPLEDVPSRASRRDPVARGRTKPKKPKAL